MNSSWVDARKVYGMTGLSPEALVGAGCEIRFPELVVMRGWSRIDSHAYVSVGLVMEDRTVICPGAKVIGGAGRRVTLNRWAYVGWGSVVMARSESYDGLVGVGFGAPGPCIEGDIIFEPFSGVATLCSVFPGVHFPEGAVVGSNSMVHSDRDLRPWWIHYGTPAKPIRPRRLGRDAILRQAEESERGTL